jgi:membrane protease YdiL (CAAX protease family)
MDQSPERRVIFHSPGEPARPPWEIALLFLGILVILAGWHLLQTSAHRHSPYHQGEGVTEMLLGDRFAAAARAAPAASQPALWTRAAQSYRDALHEDPDILRARRGLAAALYLAGDADGARKTMGAPARLTVLNHQGRTVWKATQVAFGALPRPADPALISTYRAALGSPDLGWARYGALIALAPDHRAAAAYRAAMAREYGGGRWLWAVGVAGFAGFLLIPVGLLLLDRGLRLPRNRLPRLHAASRTLLAAFLTGFVIYEVVAGVSVASVSAGTSAAGLHSPYTSGPPAGMTLIALVIGSALGAALAYRSIAVILGHAGSGLWELGWRARDAVKWAVGGYIALLPPLAVSLLIVGALTKMFPHVKTPRNPAADMVLALHGWQLALLFVLVCVVAPLIEELLFRGLLFRALEKRYGLLIGAVAAGLIFGGIHPQLPFGFPPLFVLGVGLCYLYRISGSIVPGVLLHAANNTLALLLALAAAGAGR